MWNDDLSSACAVPSDIVRWRRPTEQLPEEELVFDVLIIRNQLITWKRFHKLPFSLFSG